MIQIKLGSTVKGKIRWFDKMSGQGMVRLFNGQSIQFFACNVVGANSHYPQLVTNVEFVEGQDVEGLIDSDEYIVRELGLINVRPV